MPSSSPRRPVIPRLPLTARLWLRRLTCGLLLGTPSVRLAAQSPTPPRTLHTMLTARAQAIQDSLSTWRAFGLATRSARLIGLGEATHGQHEAFDLKRRLTMELIRNHGVRVVAYEASASQARQIDAWVHGEGESAAIPMRGFGMLIWDVQENAALLRDLRAWNRTAAAGDRVRFVGIDAQDGQAVAARLRVLLGDGSASLSTRANSLVEAAASAVARLYQGDRAAFEALVRQADVLQQALRVAADRHPARDELRLRAAELHAFLTMYGTPSGRDRAMAALLLQQLAPQERAVVWAHNEHVKRGPLRNLGSTDLAMGGHLADALGDAYYPVGFAFGSGAFQANAPDSTGRWGYRRYAQGDPPRESLDATLRASVGRDAFLDLRTVPAESPLGRWLQAPQGTRSWGGYNVPDNPDARTRDASALPRTRLGHDYAGLVFLDRTTAATPTDTMRIIRGGP